MLKHALLAIGIAATITAIALLAPLPSGGGVPVSHGPISVPSQSPMSLDGVGVAVTNSGAWYRAAATTTTTRPVVPRNAVQPAQPRSVVPRSAVQAVNTHGCQYEAQILAAGLPPAMVGIAWRESNCTAGAKSPTGCWGLFQLCVPLHMDIFRAVCPELSAQLGNAVALDPSCNIAATVRLWNGGAGARHWSL